MVLLLFQDVRVVRDKEKPFSFHVEQGLLLSAYFWLRATCSCYATETCQSPVSRIMRLSSGFSCDGDSAD